MDAFVYRWSRACWIAGVCTIAWIAPTAAFAAESASAHRYEIRGAGTLTLDAPRQSNGGLLLKAELSPPATPPVHQTLQLNGRFALSATLAASSLVCFNDTIFRDDFDGDGF
jgi:hypothetical protein